MARRRGVAGLVIALLVVGLGVPPAAIAQAQQPKQQSKGKRVELTGQTTATTQVFAEPDGTFTMEQHPVPVRGRKDGKWAPLDTTLRFGADGKVSQTAGAVDVDFSAGGKGPLVSVAEGAAELELTWPHPLPKPELAGDTAVYREVLPGVDLKMRATRQGYAKVLMVKNRAAAANPELRTLQFGLKTAGLTVRAKPDGTAVAVDAKGQDVFHAGHPLMWDSSGSRTTAKVSMRVGKDKISLVPDQSLLTAPGTKYPVAIDPDWGVGPAAWALVFGIPSKYAPQSYWYGDGDNVAKVGYSTWEVPTVLARSYFQFDVAGLAGKHILGAEFNALETYASSCEAREVGLHETGAIDPGTSWNNQPWIGQELGRQNVAAGYSSKCSAKWLGFDVKSAVLNSVNSSYPTVTMMLKAVDEGDKLAWKKFDPNNPALIVHYNSFPNAPGGMSIDGKPCATGAGQPYISTTGPRLTTGATDPDGGGVQVKYEWYIRGGAKLGETTTGEQTSSTPFGITLAPDTYRDGDAIAWRAATYDGTDWSNWSGWCEAVIDKTRPDKPPVVSSPDFPRDGVGGGLGRTGKFLLEPNGVSDVVAYQIDLHDQPQRRIPAGADGKATALITPPEDTYYDVYVRSVDRAGNLSDLSVPYHFRPGSGTPPVASWRLNGHFGATEAPDASGKANTGRLSTTGAAWTQGKQSDAVWFDGTGFVATNAPAIRTDATFTVAAWVKADGFDPRMHTAVSQDGADVSGFHLQLDPGSKKWNFMMPSTAQRDSPRRIADSDAPAVIGRWTHLTGVFDQSTGKLSLYVDGVLQSSSAVQSTPWNAAGPFQIGRAWYAGKPADGFKGAVDEVRVYDRQLSAKEIRLLATVPTEDEGFWQLDEKSGTTAADASGNLRQAVLRGGASWTPISAVGGGAIHLDGQSGQLETGVQAIRMDNSFTVSAHVRLTDANTNWQTALSQDGPRASGWVLRYRPDSKSWSFGLSTGDADVPTMISANDPGPAQTGEWTQLTGVYDEAAREIRLYVNSVLVSAVPLGPDTRFPNIAGGLVIGRAKLHGVADRFWGGEVDHVRVFTGVRTDDQIADDASVPPLPQATFYQGQLNRWVAHGAWHTNTTGAVPRGFRFEGPMGFAAPAGTPDTKMLYSCMKGSDEFPSLDAACGGNRVIGELGLTYTTPPANESVAPIFRCAANGSGELFMSHEANCEGQRVDGALGYVRQYAYLIRYREIDGLGEHWSGIHSVPANFRTDTPLGIVSTGGMEGTTDLSVCRKGTDSFLSVQPDCEGAQFVQPAGLIWKTPPAGVPSTELLRCKMTTTGELFESLDPGCEGQLKDRPLGYVRTTL